MSSHLLHKDTNFLSQLCKYRSSTEQYAFHSLTTICLHKLKIQTKLHFLSEISFLIKFIQSSNDVNKNLAIAKGKNKRI